MSAWSQFDSNLIKKCLLLKSFGARTLVYGSDLHVFFTTQKLVPVSDSISHSESSPFYNGFQIQFQIWFQIGFQIQNQVQSDIILIKIKNNIFGSDKQSANCNLIYKLQTTNLQYHQYAKSNVQNLI